MKYDYKAVEAKWQKVWEDEKTFHVEIDHSKPKFYALVEFPYPVGCRPARRPSPQLHRAGRRQPQAPQERLQRAVPHGLGRLRPAHRELRHEEPHPPGHRHQEQRGPLPPASSRALGFSFDWDREINTTDPEYYKWTQWIFLQLYKHGLAYKKEMNVNWCTGCKCVLANEEVVNGVCERCGSEVVHRVKSQWMLKITAYADKLIDGLDGLDYIERVVHPAEELDRPQPRRGGQLRHHRGRHPDRLHHPLRYPVRRYLHGRLPGARHASRSGWRKASSRMPTPSRLIRPRLPARATLSAAS